MLSFRYQSGILGHVGETQPFGFQIEYAELTFLRIFAGNQLVAANETGFDPKSKQNEMWRSNCKY
jgi:hypothetical protein